MSTKIVKLIKNSDDTTTVKIGSAVEHITIFGKSKYELFESIKWAIYSKGVVMDDLTIVELMTREGIESRS